MKTILACLLALLSSLYVSNCYASEDLQVLLAGREAKVTYQVLDEDRLLVSVLDDDENPIRGLKPADFVIQRGIKRARIVSAEPLETSEEIPLNIVFVVDNSSSMKRRKAVEPLLSALEEFLRTVRPIDNIHVVVFSTKETMKVKGYTLHAKTFHSSQVSELRDFFRDAFSRGLTSGTYLYDAMVAGVDLIRKMPEKDQKFLVVFSDGEDINSSVAEEVVESEAVGIPSFQAYCVDFMRRAKVDPFLQSFAQARGGRIWKARSAKEFIPIFQAFTTTLLYRYVISYRILAPPHGTLAIEPAELSLDVLTMIGGAPLMTTVFFETGKSDIPDQYVLLRDRAETASFDVENLTSALDRYYNVLNLVGEELTRNPTARVRFVGCNSDTGVEKSNLGLSRRRAEVVRDYLSDIWGIESYRMEIEARNLPANPTPMIVAGGRPENQRVEIVFDSTEMREKTAQQFIGEASNRNKIAIRPQIVAEYGVADWELTILADGRAIHAVQGTGELEESYTFTLDKLGREKLTGFNELEAQIRVADIYDDAHEAVTSPCPIRLSKKEVIHEIVGPLSGMVAIEPETLTIEELTTIDSSPLLNYVFFETGKSEIPDRYIVFTHRGRTETFDETDLKGTMEKYQAVLNIIGKRLVDNSDARIKIVGCNSNRGVEHGRTDLSRSRAEAARAYLRQIWGIELWRMDLETRNLPAAPSSSGVAEGRVENQRAEIHSDTLSILDTIESTYVEKITDADQLRILPDIESGYGLAHWMVRLRVDGTLIESIEGDGDLLPAYSIDLEGLDLRNLGSYSEIEAEIEVVDKRGESYHASANSSVHLVRREERLAQKMGYRVQEKYALILFDYDSATIKDRNKAVVDRIVKRIQEVPDAIVTIVGHTDIIGTEEYNMALSERRAKAVYDYIMAAGVPASDRMTFEGAGPYNPLFDNRLPEGRALNRTVTVTLEYEKKE